jgi:hypothetical protein
MPRNTKAASEALAAKRATTTTPTKKVNASDALVKLAPQLDDFTLAQLILSSPTGYNDARQYLDTGDDAIQYPADATTFMRETLGFQVWPKLQEITESVMQNHNTVVESGFSLGKSVTASAIIAWFMSTTAINEEVTVVTLAPTWGQVNNILWRYLRSFRNKGLPGIILDSARWEISPRHYAVGMSPKRSSSEDETTIQGYHAPKMLVVMDEAAGIPRMIWNAVSGLATSEGSRILAIGNPIEQSGPFWEACNNPNWNHIRIGCLDHPNVVEGREVIPGAVSRGWIEERCEDWATEVEPDTPGAIEIPWNGKWFLPMPIFMAKVMGIAPEQAEDQLIRLSWVIDAQDKQLGGEESDVIIGFDPAPRGGDDNALCIRKGNTVIKILRRKGQDTQELANWVQLVARENNAKKIYIDDIGSGSGVVDRTRVLGLPVIAVNFSRAAMQRQRFANLRAEAYWRLRELLREGKLSLPNDGMLTGDLTAPHYSPDPYGRILIESKDDIRERIKRSPDSADALALTFVMPSANTDDSFQMSMREMISSADESSITVGRWVVSTGNKNSRIHNWRVGKSRR